MQSRILEDTAANPKRRPRFRTRAVSSGSLNNRPITFLQACARRVPHARPRRLRTFSDIPYCYALHDQAYYHIRASDARLADY